MLCLKLPLAELRLTKLGWIFKPLISGNLTEFRRLDSAETEEALPGAKAALGITEERGIVTDSSMVAIRDKI